MNEFGRASAGHKIRPADLIIFQGDYYSNLLAAPTSNHLTMTTGTKNGQLTHQLFPKKFGIVASPSELIPDLEITLLRVSSKILRSNHKD